MLARFPTSNIRSPASSVHTAPRGRLAGLVAYALSIVLVCALARSAHSQEATWSDLPSLPRERQEVGVAALGGKVYVIGGIHPDRSAASEVDRYDVASGAWEEIAPLPEQLHHVGAAAASGRVFAIGGLDARFRGVRSVYAYSPESNEWEPRADLPETRTSRGRGAMGVAAVAGRIYAAGGQDGGTSFRDFAVYLVEEDRWMALPPMPTARNHLAAVAIDGVVHAISGRSLGLRPEVEAYDVATGEWKSLPPIPTPRGGIAAAAVGTRIYVLGGEGNRAVASGIFDQVEAFDTCSRQWASLEPMPHPRHGIGAAVVDGAIHVPGGAPVEGFGTTDTHDRLRPPASETTRIRAGDCNGDGLADLSDAICLLGHLFLGDPATVPCGDGKTSHVANRRLLDANGDRAIDASDSVYVLSFLFLGTAPPAQGTDCVEIPCCPDRCSG